MDKSSDSSSDSDSNSSTSWVFIEDTITCPKTANTFHLDCSREPIQELTEQDLLSAGSDFESDTDGISVISESEVPNDDPCLNIHTSDCVNNTATFEDNADLSDHENNIKDADETTDKEVLLIKEQHEKLTKINPLHMLGIGFVLTAVFLACYSRITTKISKENTDYTTDDAPLYKKIDLTSCDVPVKMYDTKTDLNKDLEEIVDITMTCAFHNKPKNDILDEQIKKCVKKEYNTKKTGKNIYNESIERKKIEIKSKKCTRDDDKISKIKNENHASYKKDDKIDSTNKENVIKLRLPKKKLNLQEQFKKDSNKIPIKNPYKYQKDEYHKDKPSTYHKNRKYNYVDQNLESKYYQNKAFKKYKKNIQKKHKVNKFKVIPVTIAKIKDSKYKDKMRLQKRNNTTGEWYINLHKARNQLRKQEHVSDWVFDRAYLRNKKRNKAQWYFKWMNIREQLRYKQSYKPYSS